MSLHLLLAGFVSAAGAHPQETIAGLAAGAERLEAQGQLEAAAVQYRKILRLDPRSIPALNALGGLNVRQGKFQEGISYYDPCS